MMSTRKHVAAAAAAAALVCFGGALLVRGRAVANRGSVRELSRRSVSPEPTCNPNDFNTALIRCGIMEGGVFKDCNVDIDPAGFIAKCILNTACAKIPQDICSMIKTYADECSTKGKPAKKWRERAKCPIECKGEDNKMYSNNVNCQRTCSSMNASQCSTNEHSDGCKCKDNFYEHNGRCLKKSECGCFQDFMEGGSKIIVSMQVGDQIFNKNCTMKLQCVEPGNIVETEYIKDVNAICDSQIPPVLECAEGFTLQEDEETCESTSGDI